MRRRYYKYRLYPTQEQAAALNYQLAEACVLYNAALQERRDAWQMARKTLNYHDQANQLKVIRADGTLGLTNYHTCQDVLRRVDRTFAAFFRRVKAGTRRAGYPRFRSASRYDSYTFPAYGDGCKLRPRNRLYLQGIGEVKVKLHRVPERAYQIKTVTIKRDAGHWYACFTGIGSIPDNLPISIEQTGIDVGVTHFAVLSDGSKVANPRYQRQAQMRLRRAQRKVARRKRGSGRRLKAVQELWQANAHVRYQRADFHHKVSRQLINRYGLIVVEDLNIQGLASGMRAQSVMDAAWGGFLKKLTYKAEEAGRTLIKVNPSGTSQRCPCGAAVPKKLQQRWHHCESCGLSVSRDEASAMEILRLGLSLQASSPTTSLPEKPSQEGVVT